jgi:hypothetical protein
MFTSQSPSAGFLACVIVLSATLSSAAPIGPNRVAVVLFNFQNDRREPITPAEAEGLVFANPDSAAAYWKEVSAGAVTLSGDVYGWFTIDADVGPCSQWMGWMIKAEAAAVEAGMNAADYDQIVFTFPSPPGNECRCGSTYFDAKRLYVHDIRGCLNHELGHNFGLAHAWGYRCRDAGDHPVAMSESCTAVEYRDWFDIMGMAYENRHLSNWRKTALGFLSPAEFPGGSVKTVHAPGTFMLAPSEEPLPGRIQMLRVPRTVDAACIVGDFYYLEFRQPYGYFDDFAPTDPAVNGVTVRFARSNDVGDSSFLVDTNPGGVIDGEDFMDAPLAAGQTFSDPVSGVRVHTVDVTPEGATVQVSPPPLGDADGDGFVRCLDDCPGTANPDQADGDGDGIGDACDLCTTSIPGQSWTAPRITVSNVGDGQPGNERATIGARFTLATGRFSVNPLVDGARLQLRTAAGEPALDVTLPGGSYVPPGPGGTVSASGRRFSFGDRRRGGSGGVQRMQISDRRGGDVEITVVANKARLALTPADAPLQATVVLGGAGAGAAGECGEVRFAAAQCDADATEIRCR